MDRIKPKKRHLKVKLSYFKTLWKERDTPVWAFICPVCEVHRRVRFRQQPGGWHYVQIALTSFFVTLLTWNWLEWKGIISFLPLWTVFEITYRIRMRIALGCPHCGFDPYLYLNDEEKAKQGIEQHFRKLYKDKGIPFPEKPLGPSAPPRETPLTENVD